MTVRLAALLLILPLLGLWLKVVHPPGPDFDRVAGIALAGDILRANGIVQDHTSDISISGQAAAVVFTPPSCRGAIVLVPLPPTAQRFETVVAGLDQSVAAEGFVHRGQRLDRYPHLRTIAQRIGHALYLPGTARSAWSTTVFAYRELGQCGLSPTLDWTLPSNKEEIS